MSACPRASSRPSLDGLDGAADNEKVNKLTREELSHFFAEETLFSAVSEAARERVVSIVRQSILAKDGQLFAMGPSCESLHFVVRGAASLVKTSPEGRQRILHRALPGGMVAAVPFFDGRGYPATFVADTDCLVASLPRDGLLPVKDDDRNRRAALVRGYDATAMEIRRRGIEKHGGRRRQFSSGLRGPSDPRAHRGLDRLRA